MTKQRKLIFEIVKASTQHMTAEQVFCAAKEQMHSIVLATVYNNLNAMTSEGLMRRVRIFGQPDRYDYMRQPHDHLVCDHCGAITDISLGDFLSELEEKTGLRLEYYELNMHYICDACKERIADGKNISKIN